MSIVIKSEEITTTLDCDFEIEENIVTRDEGGGCLIDNLNYNSSTSSLTMENEKRIRREIANSNERRRMQSINAGFQSLKSLLPHHEGEKLSKAAILQQTAEYVYALEQERTQLLSQNCQLKRLLDQSDTSSNGEPQTAKKRKFDNVMTMQTISDSSDEGLGSMSPEPITIFTVLTKHPSGATQQTQTTFTPKEFMELKHQLEIEKRNRIVLEEQLRQLECQYSSDRMSEVSVQFQHHEVIDHTDNVRDEPVSIIKEVYTKSPLTDIKNHPDLSDVQVVETIPASVVQTQVVVLSDMDIDRPLTPSEEIIVEEEKTKDDNESQITSTPVAKLQPILEAAIKAEPKVEVERINSPTTITVAADEEVVTATVKGTTESRMYLTSTSRQNLKTIVEAIRHLEGDPLFGEITEPTQDAPLALTTTKSTNSTTLSSSTPTKVLLLPQSQSPTQSKLKVEMNSFLHFRSAPTSLTNNSQTTNITSHIVVPAHQQHIQHQQQCRPGVIVGKQNS